MKGKKKKYMGITAILVSCVMTLGYCGAIMAYAEEPSVKEDPSAGSGTDMLSGDAVSAVTDVIVHTYVRPAGHCLEALEVTVSDAELLKNLEAKDFTLEGQATKWMDENLHDFTAAVSDVSVEGNVMTLTITDFTEKYFYVDHFTVTCTSDPALSFDSSLISKVITPVANDFTQVRKSEGASFDYNIYIPDDISEPLPVVVAFHGYGDSDNLLQNQVAVSWAFPQNQLKRPAIVIAPIIEGWNYLDADYRDMVYTETYHLIQGMIREGKIDKNRIYTVGKSCGGMAVYEFTEKYAADVAGAIAMCGAEGISETALAQASLMKEVPIWIVQAASDDTVPASSSLNMYHVLEEAGSTVAKLRLYSDDEMHEAGVDGTLIGYHTVEMAVLADHYDGEEFMSWLFAQSRTDEDPVERVVELIGSLPEKIAPENEQAVMAARKAYDALTDEQKEYVTNYEKLVDAEKAIAEWKEAAEKENETKQEQETVKQDQVPTDAQIQQSKKAEKTVSPNPSSKIQKTSRTKTADRKDIILWSMFVFAAGIASVFGIRKKIKY